MLLTVNRLNDVLSGVVGNDKYSIPFNQDTYKSLLDLEDLFASAKTMDQAKATIESALQIIDSVGAKAQLESIGEFLKLDKTNNKFYLHNPEKNVTSSVPMPDKLASKITECIEKDITFLPFIKCWMWFLKNPVFSLKKADYFAKYITTLFVDREMSAKLIEEGYSKEKADELATFSDVSITKNGLLSTYKYVRIKYTKVNTESGETENRYAVTFDPETGEPTIHLPKEAEDYYLIPPIMGEGGDAFFSGDDLGHRVTIGKTHTLPDWDMVNCSDGRAGLPGLHLGGLTYIKGYAGNDRLLLNCFVNPMHIGAFTDTGDGAIRVKEYFVHSAQFAPNRGLYHESGYLAQSDAQWMEMRTQAIEESEARIAAEKAKQAEVDAL